MSLSLVTLARYGGWAALTLLLLALCATPAARVLARLNAPYAQRVSRVRRALGILSAVFALAHAVFALLALQVPLVLAWSWPHLRAGVMAAGVLAALLLTSYPRVVTALHLRGWKALHRLAYVAAGLALVHVLLAPFAQVAVALTLFACVLAFGALRFLPNR